MPKTSSKKTVAAAPAKTATTDATPSGNAGNLYILHYLSPTVGKATADVAAAIGIGRSTAQKALTSLETEGLTRREPGVREGARRSPDLWFDARTPTDAADDPDGDTPLEASQESVSDPLQPEASEPDTTATGPNTPEQSDPDRDDVHQDHAEKEDGQTAEVAPAETKSTDTDPDVPEASAPEEDGAEQGGVEPEDVETAEPAPAEAAEPEEAAPTEQSAPPAAPDVSPKSEQDAAPDAAAAQEKRKKPPTKKVLTKSAPATDTQPEPTDAPATPRLAHGELRTMVADFLRAHPERAWTPSAIAKALGGKSAGAVANACEKLMDAMDGALKTFEDAPRRYQYTPPAPAKPKKTK